MLEILWLASSIRDGALHDDRERRYRIGSYPHPRQRQLWAWRRVRGEQISPASILIAWSAIVAGVWMGMLILQEALAIAPSDDMREYFALASAPFGVALGALIYRASLRTHRRRIEAELAGGDPVCLVCAHDLTGLERERDHCLVCPECGHAWRIA